MTENAPRDPYHPRTIAPQEHAMQTFIAQARQRPSYITDSENPVLTHPYAFGLGGTLHYATEGFARTYPQAARLTIGKETVAGVQAYEQWMRGGLSPNSALGVFPLTESTVQNSLTLQMGDATAGSQICVAAINRAVFSTGEDGQAELQVIGATETLSAVYLRLIELTSGLIKSYFYDYEEARDGSNSGYEHYLLTPNTDTIEPQQVASLLGAAAADVYAQYGSIGLAQYRLQAGMNNICAGLLG